MARGRHYAKLSISNAPRLSFSDLCILLFLFLSLCRFLFSVCLCFFCSHWSLVDVPLIFFCPADHVPDWQPRVLLGMVEARSVNVKKTTTTTTSVSLTTRLEDYIQFGRMLQIFRFRLKERLGTTAAKREIQHDVICLDISTYWIGSQTGYGNLLEWREICQ